MSTSFYAIAIISSAISRLTSPLAGIEYYTYIIVTFRLNILLLFRLFVLRKVTVNVTFFQLPIEVFLFEIISHS